MITADTIQPHGAYPDPELVTTAIDNAVAAATGDPIGTHGLLIVKPAGWVHEIVDERVWEDTPRDRSGSLSFMDVAGFAQYVNRYKTDDSLAYAHHCADYAKAIAGDLVQTVTVVLDDFPVAAAARREHRARLALVPTVEAHRWCRALNRVIGQEELLDLVVDGAAEVFAPEAADLRDLVANLHAIRTTEVESVIRSGGEGTIKLTENVNLRSGPSSTVAFPEYLRIQFVPFVSVAMTVSIDVRVKATVKDRHVVFSLTAPTIDTDIHAVVDVVAANVANETGLLPMWRTDTAA